MSIPFRTLLIAFGMSLAVRPCCAELPATDVQSTVQTSLEFLRNDMHVWRNQRRCAACHHGPMYLWASTVAESNGYTVDEQDLSEHADWLVSNDARLFRPSLPGATEKPRLSQGTIYLAHALNALPSDNKNRVRGWKRIADHWQATQQESGAWLGPAGRPPIFNTPEILTQLISLAIVDSADKSQENPSSSASDLQGMHKRAESWLTSTTMDVSHQGLVLNLWRATNERDPNFTEHIDRFVKTLRELQQTDGGWSQGDGLPSDAFATGQTLFVFHRAGIGANDEAVNKGIDYLVQSQQSNGTWPMRSRSDPATNMPAGNLNPITYAATSWATIGMSLYVPETRARSGRVPLTPKMASSAAADVNAKGIHELANCPIGECPGQ